MPIVGPLSASNGNSIISVTGSIEITDGGLVSVLSGSLTRLTDGRSFLANGPGINVVTSSDGQITISNTAESKWVEGANFLRPSSNSGGRHIVVGGTGLASADILLNFNGSAEFNKQQSAQNFTVSSQADTDALKVDGGSSKVYLGSASPSDADLNVWVSGSSGKRGTASGKTTVFGGDVVVSGSFRGKQIHHTILGGDITQNEKYFFDFYRFRALTEPGPTTQMVCPFDGRLRAVHLRTQGAYIQCAVGVHIASNGTPHISENATDTQLIGSTPGMTTNFAKFNDNAAFGGGSIVGISIVPTTTGSFVGEVYATAVWEWDTHIPSGSGNGI